jgi:8-oxo-dGTP pyrophosphatase MutT (NUDIX family)
MRLNDASPNVAAAFILFRSSQGRCLLLRRAATEDHPGEWSLPGGKLKSGETAPQAAVREAYEETRYSAGHAGKWHCRRVKDGVDATTFLQECESEFVPTLNSEHDAWQWVMPSEALEMNAEVAE